MLGSENQVLGGFVVSIDWENDNTLQTYSARIYVFYLYIYYHLIGTRRHHGIMLFFTAGFRVKLT
jgi:hypothetical protein